MKPLCILNLSDPAKPPLDTAPLSFGTLVDPAQTPEQIPDSGALILYVVGHAFPNAVVQGPSLLVDEAALARRINSRREGKKTLIVWDFCFARSFFEIPSFQWTAEYAHIFSCQAYERTWHGGEQTQPLTTRFSGYLDAAIRDLRNPEWPSPLSWPALQDRLRSYLRPMQTPEIVTLGPTPSDFDL